ncbi:MAG: translation initiation factor IF-6 [Methanobrevibacter sp.]|jgi:translation initiation factor 6|nr:translation initiation factor IF-6 [Candidatus Methanoflexus mossambicus]
MLKRLNIMGNPNMGVYISVNDEVALVPLNFPIAMENEIKEALDVDVVKTSISGSGLLGALSVGNENGFIVSPYIYDNEIDDLNDAGINIELLPDKYTAVGNIIAINNKGAIVSPLLNDNSINLISEFLNVNVQKSTIAGFNIIGSLLVVTNKGALVHPEASLDELEFISKVFKVDGDIGSVGKGIPLVGACTLSNSYGAIVPEATTGPEIIRVEDALGFLDD